MHFTVTHHGVPLGMAELTPTGFAVARLAPLPAYDSVRGTVRAASEFLWRMGVLADQSPPAVVSLDKVALSRAASLPLELRDQAGAALSADYINILEFPDPADAPLLVARFGHASASTLASRRVPPDDEAGRHSGPDV